MWWKQTHAHPCSVNALGPEQSSEGRYRFRHQISLQAPVMAEVAALEQPTLKGDTIPPSPTQKRKRGTESASPESRRSKRGVAAANMQVANGEAPDQQVYLDSAMAAAHPPPDNLTDADFSALQQATVDHNDVSDPANASSTAAAALGSMYPTLHVPQATEETFVSHTGVEPEHSEAPFNVTNDGLPMDTSALENIQQPSPPNGVRQDLPRYPQAQKPAVGSEEWHKLRKDNHKEGWLNPTPRATSTPDRSQMVQAYTIHTSSRTPKARDHQRGDQRACKDRTWLRKEQGINPTAFRRIHYTAQGK